MYRGLTHVDAALEALTTATVSVAHMVAELELMQAERDATVAERDEALSDLARAREDIEKWIAEYERLQRAVVRLANGEDESLRGEGGS